MQSNVNIPITTTTPTAVAVTMPAQQDHHVQPSSSSSSTVITSENYITESIINRLLETVFAIETRLTPTLFAVCYAVINSKIDELASEIMRGAQFTGSSFAKLFQLFQHYTITNKELIMLVNDEERLEKSGGTLSSVMCNTKLCVKFLKLIKIVAAPLVKEGTIEEKSWFEFLIYCCHKNMPEVFHDEALQSVISFAALFPEHFESVVLPQLFENASNGDVLIESDGIDIVFTTANVLASAKFPEAYCRVVTPYLEKHIFNKQSPLPRYEHVFMFPLCCAVTVFSNEFKAHLAQSFIDHFMNERTPAFLVRLMYIIDVTSRDYKRKQYSGWLFARFIPSIHSILDRLMEVAKIRHQPKLRSVALNVIGRTCFAGQYKMSEWRDISYQLFWDVLQIEIEETETRNVLNVVGFFKASHKAFYTDLREEHVPHMNQMCHKMFSKILEYDKFAQNQQVKLAILELLESVLIHGVETINSEHTLFVWNLLRSMGRNLDDAILPTAAKCLQFFTQCFRVIYKQDPQTLISLFTEDWKVISSVVTRCLAGNNYAQLNAAFMFLGRITLKSLLMHIEFDDRSLSAIDKLVYFVDRATTELTRICVVNPEDIGMCQRTKRDIAYFISTLVLRYFNKQKEEHRVRLLTSLKKFLHACLSENLLEYMAKAEEDVYRTYLMLSIDAICTIVLIDINLLNTASFYEQLGDTFLPVLQIHITSTSRAQKSLYVFLKKLDMTIESHMHFIPQSSKWFLIDVIERKMQEILESQSPDLYQLFSPMADRVLSRLKLHIFDNDSEEENSESDTE
jgi:hypothetical protein